jgi:dTDP-4-dehydrorhamnose 3,5-epimerase
MPFHFTRLSLPDVVLIVPTRHRDDRGFFSETFRASAFESHVQGPFVQDNLARSAAGVLRGLHFQLAPKAQGKLIQVLSGEICDVAVDLRRSSPTFGRWVSTALSAETGQMLWVPPGFAHGYVVTSSGGADVAYKVTAEYEPTLDRGIRWDDPEIGIEWPMVQFIVSKKDRGLPLLSEAETLFD